jgi:YnbE-like lipoprotein
MTQPLTTARDNAIRRNMKKGLFLLLPLGGLILPGCVQVAAPDKPIVINLTLDIRGEVLFKLDEASKKVIEGNSEIF